MVSVPETTVARIQRRRAKGWRMPEGAIYVGRGSQWGNPWRVMRAGRVWGVAAPGSDTPNVFRNTPTEARQFAADAFRDRCRCGHVPNLDELRGRHLACWCPAGDPCHADVLLEIANA